MFDHRVVALSNTWTPSASITEFWCARSASAVARCNPSRPPASCARRQAPRTARAAQSRRTGSPGPVGGRGWPAQWQYRRCRTRPAGCRNNECHRRFRPDPGSPGTLRRGGRRLRRTPAPVHRRPSRRAARD